MFVSTLTSFKYASLGQLCNHLGFIASSLLLCLFALVVVLVWLVALVVIMGLLMPLILIIILVVVFLAT